MRTFGTPGLAAGTGILAVLLVARGASAEESTDVVEEVEVSYPGHLFDAGRARGNVELEATAEGSVATGGGAAQGGGRAALGSSFWLGWEAPSLDGTVIFHGPLDPRRGLILEADADLALATQLAAGEGMASAWSVAEEASLVLGAVTLAQRLGFQRPTRWSDRLWSPQRRVLSLGGRLHMPAVLRAERFDVFDLALTVDVLGRDGAYVGTDAELRMAIFSLHWGPPLSRTELAIVALEAQVDERVLPLAEEGGLQGSGYVRIMADVVSLSGVRLSPSWRLGARLGVAVNDSIELSFEHAPAEETAEESDALMSVLWALDVAYSASELAPFVPLWSWAQRSQPVVGNGFALGLLSFERIDPTGLALDVGGQLAAHVSWTWDDRWSLSAEGALVLAYRQGAALGEPLPAEVPQVGDVYLMGRAAAEVAYRVGSVVWVRASAFAEHSDRDDLLLLGRWSPELTWRIGGTLGLSLIL